MVRRQQYINSQDDHSGVKEEDEVSDSAKEKPDGYDIIAEQYLSGNWEIQKVHQFVRVYKINLEEKNFTPHNPAQVVLGTLVLWLSWLMFNGGSSLGIVDEKGTRSQLAMINSIMSPAVSSICTFFTKKYIVGKDDSHRLDFQAFTNGILAGLVAVNGVADAC